jgi:hypothetical protein
MRIRRRLPVVLAVLAIAAGLTLIVQLRKHAPPEAARLLPGADAFLYADLRWARGLSQQNLPPVTHDPEYERFIQQTGIQFERDLEEAAFAVHYPSRWPGGGTGGNAPEPRFSEVLVGKFDGERLTAYLRQSASTVESCDKVDVFSIPLEGRTLRVALLSADSVAASNLEDPRVICGIVERSRRRASPFGGPQLLRQHYKHVPFASQAWVVARNSRGLGLLGTPPELSFDGAWVLSARYIRALHLRLEAFTPNDLDAHELIEKLKQPLDMLREAETSTADQNADEDAKAFFESLSVTQQGSRAVGTAVIPPAVLKRMLTGGASSATRDTK